MKKYEKMKFGGRSVSGSEALLGAGQGKGLVTPNMNWENEISAWCRKSGDGFDDVRSRLRAVLGKGLVISEHRRYPASSAPSSISAAATASVSRAVNSLIRSGRCQNWSMA